MFNGMPGLVDSAIRFWHRSYAADYIGLALVTAAFFSVKIFVEPVHQLFRLDDTTKQYPHAEVQRVSSNQNILCSGIIPLILLVVWALLLRPGIHKAHVTILGLFISLIFTSFLTDIIKNAIGRPRPDLIARCKPEKGTPQHDLISVAVCTETDHHTLHDGWRSFPSGHSSFAFAGLGYLALVLAGQLHVFRPRVDLFRIVIALAPLLGALLIALSRIADYRHDKYDVTVGSALGIMTAYLTYRHYYPRLKHPRCDEPYPNTVDIATTRNIPRPIDIERQMNDANDFELGDLSDEEVEAGLLNTSRSSRRGKQQQDHG